LIIICSKVFAQSFADKKFYLIDNLDLSAISSTDRQLIDSCLVLYHKATHDTSRANYLEFLCDNMEHSDWERFQQYQYIIIKKALQKPTSKPVSQHLKIKLLRALNNIGSIYIDSGDIKKAMECYQKSYDLLEELSKAKTTHEFHLDYAKVLNNIGYIYMNQGNIPEALRYYNKSIRLLEEIDDKGGLSALLNNVGYIYGNQGNISMALEYLHKSLKIHETLGDKKSSANSMNNIGHIYQQQGDANIKNNERNNLYATALDYFNKCLKIYEEIGDKSGVATVLNNIGVIYRNKGNLSSSPLKKEELFKKVLEYYNKSLNLRKEIGDKKGIAICLNNLGGIYKDYIELQKEDFKKEETLNIVLDYYNEGLKIYEELGDKQGIATSLVNIGDVYIKQQKLQKAHEYSFKGLTIAQEIGYPANIRDAAKTLAQVFEQQNQGIKALEMYKLFVQMKDSTNNEETKKSTAQHQAKYEYEKQKAIDDAEYEKKLGIEKEAKAKQKVITYATAGGLGLVIIFLIFVFNRLQVTKRQKNIIENQKLEVEQQKAVVEKAHLLLEEKNNEVLASIRYAKRIQDALLTSQKYIERNIKRLKS